VVVTRRERILFLTTAAVAVLLRIAALFRYRFDSDEQQHLHVTWGWTAGLVQYRDLFDNHAPLFHLGTAPLLMLFGERPDILLWMRVPMLALFGVVLWATFAIGRRLYDERIAAGAVLLLAIFPPFFLKSLEYRNDNLWTMLWMLALVALLRGRWFVAGVLLGAALATSLKTVPLVIAILVAIALEFFLRRGTPHPPSARSPLREGRRMMMGFVLVPIAVIVLFVSLGAWDELVYCNFTFNGAFAATRTHLWIGRATFPITFGALLYLVWRFRGIHFLAIVAGAYAVILADFWPAISPRDFLPVMPIAAIFASALILRAANPVRAFAIVAAVSIASLFHYADRFENKTDWHITMMDQVLRLTRPGEPLIDYKGETIYRRRPFYYALELVTRTLISKNVIRDTVAEDVIRTRTYVAQADGPMWPPRGRAFLSENFVNLGRLRAAGQAVKEDGTFTIAVPGIYVIVSEHGEAHGTLDGTTYTGTRQLAAGAHRWTGEKKVVALWAPAFHRGHSPFHPRDLDF
jgi:Dolichyl-phosphate-mannose-protein mannosyltransferase